ncbi:MAG: hypothetical protein CO183_01285 [Candidatus Zambryskibacteria bacterium CG_4_9_14_3_um_filter_42_9]|uniref:Peptidyl-tRNA hydrolase n=1 Tax=Candidatus Zambryskibacteria bacterium CG22_combo_CG10-13_8_21_14_all_42_17 TaxID=1975118 RepID=A0A2H0BE24_9BACT|nr:MAG: hypothetical protein COX06_00440 [Candidatus Zambryskibacteria bacterium CG22_combo_CG10-13_8_21_14_all_42_17]PJA36883.1 MAG: hypothetical protein CO183_01285 [Candidatus Zambryskibacteria bacterium CG_4_9_14_3_um_filter_42_9]
MYIVVGLGNPGREYALTRHNTGRMAVDFLSEQVKSVKVLAPDTFMNHSGKAVAKVVKSKKAAEKLIVIYDDLDLPLGILKISYNRGSGGHKGLESVIHVLKTREFIRIRLGIGKKKDVEKHILSNFTKSEMEILKKVFKKTKEVVQVIVEEGREKAMNKFN